MKRAIVLIAILIVAIGAASCAGSYEPRVARTEEPVRELSDYEARIAELKTELDAITFGSQIQTLSREGDSGSTDCDVAADLRGRICDLSQRICDIAEREPETPGLTLKCENARVACKDATASVARVCGGR